MWLWNPGMLHPVVIGSSLATVVIVGALYPFFGTEALYFLFMGMIGPFIGLIYGAVGRKVASLKQSLAEEKGMMEESLMVIDTMQSPGVAILTDGVLKLVPIMGESRSIDLSNVDSIRMTRIFNGKTLIWKKWLVLSVKPRLGFALPESTVQEWYEHFPMANRRIHARPKQERNNE